MRANLNLVKPVVATFPPRLVPMPTTPLTHPYVPNFALQALYRRAFKRIQVEEGWADKVRELSRKGSVLFVLPNLNWLDFLALDYLTKTHQLPPIRYTNDLGLWILNPHGPNVAGGGLVNMLLPHLRHNPEAQLRDAVTNGGSAALFLKRPPSVMDIAAGATGGRGMREGDALVRAIFRMQREGDAKLLLLPLVFIWTKAPDQIDVRPWDLLLGPRAWPTPTRALGQFAYYRNQASLHFSEEIDVGALLEANREQSDEVLVRKITYMVLRRLERERRAVVGPSEKAPERVRSEIIRSPRLQKVIQDLSGGDATTTLARASEASEMLKELQARPNQGVMKGMKVALEWGFNRIYQGIEFDQSDVDRLRQASKNGALILLPSHKSHIDYLVLSYFFYSRNLTVPVIAAGDNLNFQPIGPIFRRCGAFFIRRSFKGDRLYAAVVDAYVRRLIRDGFPIELFLEGGRSRTGRLLEPKLGLLNMIVDAAVGVPGQKVHFVPVSIGYERVIEANTYEHELAGGEKKKEEAADLLSAREVLGHRYGRISLQFGTIMTLPEVGAELGIGEDQMQRPAKRRAVVTRLGNRVMDEINRVTAVTPGALTATALLSQDKDQFNETEVFAICTKLLLFLARCDARVSSTLSANPSGMRNRSIREALQMFGDAQLIENQPRANNQEVVIYKIVENKRVQLDTSKNIIIHFFVERGFIASSLNRNADGEFLPTPLDKIRERVRWASRMFKHEFRFRADAAFEDIFDSTIAGLCQEGHLEIANGCVSPGIGEEGWSGEQWLNVYRTLLAAVFEGYLLAVQSLDRLFGGARTEKDLLKGALSQGQAWLKEKKVLRREAISKPVVVNAYHSLAEFGYIRTRSGKLELDESYKSRDALDELHSMLNGFLTGQHGAVE